MERNAIEKSVTERSGLERLADYAAARAPLVLETGGIDPELYQVYGVKRGLRDKSGKGVLAGLTNISEIQSSVELDGITQPCDGKLFYRGYDVRELVSGERRDGRFGFEEIAYLLLFGELPDMAALADFQTVLNESRTLPTNFVRDVIMKAPSRDMMNSLCRSVLTLASYDDNVADPSLANVLRQCLMLIAVMPMLAAYGYHSYNHYERDESLYIHRPDDSLSEAENLLRMLRPDKAYTQLEAQVLDLALILHMEHGGGNNSTFTTHVVTSSGSDTYSVIAAALASLKGPKHGGANIKVVEMMADLKRNVGDLGDEDEISAYLHKLLNREAFDGKGLIYGMGHAVYSISDPRAVIFRGFVESLAKEKGMADEFALYAAVERLAPALIARERRIFKGVSPNVDFYSGLTYMMLGIPEEMFTPIFAIARIVGWSAHRLEEIINMDKIIRPAYKSVRERRPFVEMDDR